VWPLKDNVAYIQFRQVLAAIKNRSPRRKTCESYAGGYGFYSNIIYG